MPVPRVWDDKMQSSTGKDNPEEADFSIGIVRKKEAGQPQQINLTLY
jgi:hypothetical protein